MKAISLWQPWASLIGRGKSIETRSWQVREEHFPMTVAIHAAKHWTQAELELCHTDPFYKALSLGLRENQSGDFYFDEMLKKRLPLGAIVATAKLVRCIPTEQVYPAMNLPEVPWYRGNLGKVYAGENEFAFGNYAPGRFAWLLNDIRILPEPIPFKGSQGFFEVPDDLLGEVAG